MRNRLFGLTGRIVGNPPLDVKANYNRAFYFAAVSTFWVSVSLYYNYEECRLLGYKNPVRTSQETHYVSTTESSQLMLCKI
jgi:hypothetical protein